MAKTIRKIEPKKMMLLQRKRVCAYARVSSGKDAMLHSLSAQVSFYSSMIQRNPDWMYVGVYADEAVTGTKGARAEFQRMLTDCRAGKIDMIITKSITRFARNTVTLLEATRELKALGVDIFFEKENIHSMSGDGELMLTLLASFAQEESLSVSENCKWRIRQNFLNGIPSTTRMNGYKMKCGEISIIPEEAEIVQMIFKCYLSGMGKNAISRLLNDMGIPAKNGGIWHDSTVQTILRNEKYQGDLLMQKRFRVDHLNKIDKPNRGELPQYFVEDNHEAIIPREMFSKTQDEIAARGVLHPHGDGIRREYPFTGKIVCGGCGKGYRRRHNSKKLAWQCGTYMVRGKKHCAAKQIHEQILCDITTAVLGVEEFDEELFKAQIKQITVFNDNRLVFSFYDGREEERTWQDPSRRDSWTPEMKQKAAEHSKRRYANE